ncbi:polyprenyl synthetase family protein [Williamsia maris]|uniref:Geranylgeranyl diphosphate synthase, type I n=1 Tax=Williamsia maris TaxID=72806 RepID=A0ABT1HFG0_9NOCA|nr:polyprenyl synthetase family protein [Williamsia maris]MCP2176977.1 geranylgeranyl diphosphate synthase, type I [Williamsia maris]
MTPTSEITSSTAVLVPDSVQGVPAAAETVLRQMFDVHRATTARISPVVATLVDQLAAFTLNGGKRVRPTFAWSGYRCAGGGTDEAIARQALTVCTALELIQACALIHDDIIDRSDTRRGRPTVHRALEAEHVDRTWSGDSGHYGVSTAILLGDLALSWADDVVASRDLPAEIRDRVQPIWAAMRTEVLAGQLLDVVGEASGDESVDAAFRVMRYKTAGYTVARPLQLGVALAGADETLADALGAVGDGLGIAFQLRDDLLGVFGDPAQTGKPSGDDLVAGKRTALLALGLQAADSDDPAAAAELRAMIGRPLTDDELDRARAILRDVGAERAVEDHIDRLVAESFEALDAAAVDPSARVELVTVATAIAGRRR